MFNSGRRGLRSFGYSRADAGSAFLDEFGFNHLRYLEFPRSSKAIELLTSVRKMGRLENYLTRLVPLPDGA